jgi:endonuclease/exonuclease/phosphatase family metal-dependent hydrolase
MITIPPKYTFYHISNNFKKLLPGKLIYLSNNINYQLNMIKGLDFIMNHFGNYDQNSNIYKFYNTKSLKLFEINDELLINILQLKLGNQNLIYFLHKNNLDGFYTNFTFKCCKIKIFLIFIRNPDNFKYIKLNSHFDIKYSYKTTLYYIVVTLFMLFKYILFDRSINKITQNIKYNKRNDLNIFYKKYHSNTSIIKKGLRIASYNIHYFRDIYNDKNTLKNVINYISDSKIDIICLQEVIIPRKFYESIYLNSIQKIKTILKENNYEYIFFDKESYLLIASKYKLYNQKIINLQINTNLRKAISADILHNNKLITITNTHLYTNTSIKKNNNQADEDIRFEQAKILMKNIKYNKHSLLFGDFNSLNISDYTTKELNKKYIYEYIHTPNSNKVINYILQYYSDSFLNNNTSYLYTSIYKRRVDYIFYKNINIKQYYNLSNFLYSDHSMIFVEI